MTDALLLRPLTDDDLDDLIALHSDPVVMRFLTGGRPEDPATTRRKLATMRRRYACLGDDPGYWAGVRQADGAFLGWFELRPVDPDSAHTLELGYRLNRSAWGHGYATTGSRRLIDQAFTRHATEVITANTMAVNTGSRRVMERCGLRYQRTFFTEFDEPAEGMEHGEVEYRLTRAEWQARAAAS